MHYDLELKQEYIVGGGKVILSSDTVEGNWEGSKDFFDVV